MLEYGHFESHNFGNSKLDISYLNGVLSAFQFINHKTDCCFDFSLKEFPKKDNSLNNFLKSYYHTEKRIDYSTIDLLQVKMLLNDWLFSFVCINDNASRQVFLHDKDKHFSISQSSDRNSFIDEYIHLLNKAINPINIYSVRALANDKVWFETENYFYLLNLKWDD